MKITKYHVVCINIKTRRKEYMTASPVTHEEGCTILSKITKYPWRYEQLEEITVNIDCLNECLPRMKCRYDGSIVPCNKSCITEKAK